MEVSREVQPPAILPPVALHKRLTGPKSPLKFVEQKQRPALAGNRASMVHSKASRDFDFALLQLHLFFTLLLAVRQVKQCLVLCTDRNKTFNKGSS